MAIGLPRRELLTAQGRRDQQHDQAPQDGSHSEFPSASAIGFPSANETSITLATRISSTSRGTKTGLNEAMSHDRHDRLALDRRSFVKAALVPAVMPLAASLA